MIPLLRAGALLLNAGAAAALPWLLGFPWPAGAACIVACAALSRWGCGRAPRALEGGDALLAEAVTLAELLGAPAPRFVRLLPGWTAASVRAGRGYGLLLGAAVGESERRAILAHEIAHAAAGDLFWEPFTDGPARLLMPLLRALPPFAIPLCPILVLAVPLARATELEADRRAARIVPHYARILAGIAERQGALPSLLYPSFPKRIAVSARLSY
ncbi:MAG: M48 family metalloprotease [Planctomycetaceae bacterium]